MKPLGQGGVLHGGGLIDGGPLLVGEDDLGVLHLDQADVSFVDHVHEGAVTHLHHLLLRKQRADQQIEQQDDQQNNAVIIQQRLSGFFYFFHVVWLSPSCPVNWASMASRARSKAWLAP